MHGRRSCSSASMLISDFPMTADGASSSSRHGCEEGIRTIFLSFLPSSPTLYVPQYPLHLIALLHFGTRYLFLVSNTGSNARASSSCLISARSASRLPAATESQLPHTPSSPRASEQVSAAPAPPQDDEGHPLTSTVDGRRPRQAVARGEAEAGTLSPSPPFPRCTKPPLQAASKPCLCCCSSGRRWKREIQRQVWRGTRRCRGRCEKGSWIARGCCWTLER